MSSQPGEHSVWRISDTNNMHVSSFHPAPNPTATAVPYPRTPTRGATGNHVTQTTSRKRQFRFSVRADIDLLKLVLRLNPYGAPHGGRLQKWEQIATELRQSGIDIDFRRARDRTGLLLEQWREQELQLLRRSASGNHEDQAKKEDLLEQISEIERAARPRDNGHEWRVRDKSRIQHTQPVVSRSTLALADISSSPQPVGAIGNGDPTKFGAIATSHNSQSHLPPLMQKPDLHGLTQSRVDNELQQSLQFGSHQGPPEKQFKNNQGQALSTRFAAPQPFGHPSTSKAVPFHQVSPDRRTSPKNDVSQYRSDLPVLRASQSLQRTNRPQHILGTAPADVGSAHVVTSSPRIGDSQNIQLDAVQPSLPRPPLDNEAERLRAYVMRIEKRLDDIAQISRQRLKLEERRLLWEQEREEKRLQVERERMQKEFDERQAEREERRRLLQAEKDERHRQAAADKEERDRLMKMILRNGPSRH